MHLNNAVIKITNLRLRTLVGFNTEERIKKQDVIINIEVSYQITPEALRDQVQHALDYKMIAKRVIAHVEDHQFLLLEKLAADVLRICGEHPNVKRACVTVDKPHALRYADSVSISLEYQANQPSHLSLLKEAS